MPADSMQARRLARELLAAQFADRHAQWAEFGGSGPGAYIEALDRASDGDVARDVLHELAYRVVSLSWSAFIANAVDDNPEKDTPNAQINAAVAADIDAWLRLMFPLPEDPKKGSE